MDTNASETYTSAIARHVSAAEAIEPDSLPRRSVVLRLATWLANLYVILLAGDALLEAGVLVTIGRVSPSTYPGLRSVRDALAGAIVLETFLAIPFLLLFVPHLPKLPFLPMIAFTTAGFVTVLDRTVFGGEFAARLGVPATSVNRALDYAFPCVAAASILLLRARTGGWLLSASRLPRKRYLVVRTVFASAVTLGVVLLTAFALMVVGLLRAIEHQASGYLKFTGSGVVVRESVLTKDGRTVMLLPMVHFGEDDFYRTIYGEIPAGSLVLAEGITDREQRLPGFHPTLKIARALGLVMQPAPAVAVRMGAGHAVEAGAGGTGAGVRPDVVLADVDMASFSDRTIAMLRAVADLYDSASVGEAIRRLSACGHAGSFASVRGDLIDKRNANLLRAFDERAGSYSTIVIPWGAWHMPGLETGLRERGYRVDAQREHTVMRFQTMVPWLSGAGTGRLAGSGAAATP